MVLVNTDIFLYERLELTVEKVTYL